MGSIGGRGGRGALRGVPELSGRSTGGQPGGIRQLDRGYSGLMLFIRYLQRRPDNVSERSLP